MKKEKRGAGRVQRLCVCVAKGGGVKLGANTERWEEEGGAYSCIWHIGGIYIYSFGF